MYKNNIFYKTIISFFLLIVLSFVVFSCNISSPSSSISHSHYGVGNGQKHSQTNLKTPIIPFTDLLDAPRILETVHNQPYRVSYFGKGIGTPSNPLLVYIDPQFFQLLSEGVGTTLHGISAQAIENKFKQDLSSIGYTNLSLNFVSEPLADVKIIVGDMSPISQKIIMVMNFPSHAYSIKMIYNSMSINTLSAYMNMLNIPLNEYHMNQAAGMIFQTLTNQYRLFLVYSIHNLDINIEQHYPDFQPNPFTDLVLVENIFMHDISHTLGLAHAYDEDGTLSMSDLGLIPIPHHDIIYPTITAQINVEHHQAYSIAPYLYSILTIYGSHSINYLTQYNANDMKTLKYLLNWS